MFTFSVCATRHRQWLSVLAVAVCVMLQACGSAPYQTTNVNEQALQTARSPQSVQVGGEVALYAMSLLDTQYAWGGRGPATGFDCSGLVSHVFREAAGIKLQGSAAALAKQTRPVPTQSLQAGDLLFFNTLGQPNSHVGVYLGNGKFIHAANERTGVRVDRINDRYYANRFEGAHAVIE